jgi:hypothetical protein
MHEYSFIHGHSTIANYDFMLNLYLKWYATRLEKILDALTNVPDGQLLLEECRLEHLSHADEIVSLQCLEAMIVTCLNFASIALDIVTILP